MREGASDFLPAHLRFLPVADEPPQNLKEYDPEWGRSFWSGTVGASCDHERMLQRVKVPAVLLTHHSRVTNEENGFLLGAMTDQQAEQVQRLLESAGVAVSYRSFPDVGHAMHSERPELYVETLVDWVDDLEG
jgi:hypothetical protein